MGRLLNTYWNPNLCMEKPCFCRLGVQEACAGNSPTEGNFSCRLSVHCLNDLRVHSVTSVSDLPTGCLCVPKLQIEVGIHLLTDVWCVQCSSTCAGGSQRRVVVCQDENGYTANDCVERIKPDEQRACESGPCPQWAYGSWGEVRESHPFVCPVEKIQSDFADQTVLSFIVYFKDEEWVLVKASWFGVN